MTISLRAAGAIVAGTTSAAPAYPAGITSTDIVMLTATWKASTCTTPAISGWTIIADHVFGSGTDGVGTGPIRNVVWRKDTVAGGESGTITVTPAGGSNVVLAGIIAFARSAGSGWSVAVDWGTDDTFAVNLSATGQVTQDFTNGDDMVFVCTHGANSNQGSTTVTTPGITYGTVTEHADVGSSNGNAARLGWYSRPPTAGTATGASTVTSTIAASTTGGAHLLRLREGSGPSSVTATVASAYRVLATTAAATVASAWNVASSSTPVTASVASAWAVRATQYSNWAGPVSATTWVAVTATAASAWNVLATGQVTQQVATAYRVLATTVPATADTAYRVLAQTSPATADSAYRVLQQQSATHDSAYRVLATIGAATQASAWNVLVSGQVTQQVAVAWDVLTTTAPATVASTYRVLQGVDATRPAAYRVLAAVEATRSTAYAIRAAVTASVASAWNVLVSGQVAQTVSAAWDVLATVAPATAPTAYRVLQTLTPATAATAYRVLATMSPATAGTAWAIRAEVSKTTNSAWDVLEARTATAPTAYRVLSTTSPATAPTAWNIAEQVSKTANSAWNVAGPGAGPVGNAVAAAWDVLERLTATQPTAYDVLTTLGSPATRASTYRVLGLVTKTTNSAWGIDAQVTATAAAAYNVLTTLAPATAPASWNVLTSLAARTFSSAWKVNAGITATAASAWTVEQMLAMPIRILAFSGPWSHASATMAAGPMSATGPSTV